MKFSMLATMDGNNSLKLVDNTFRSGLSRIDDRISTSSRWITPEDVDRFKDEKGEVSPYIHITFFIFTAFPIDVSS